MRWLWLLALIEASQLRLHRFTKAHKAQITYIIRSQRSPRDVHFAKKLASSLKSQHVSSKNVHMLHELDLQVAEDDNPRGYWTLKSYLPVLSELPASRQSPWYLIAEPNTIINVTNLERALSLHDSSSNLLLGKQIETIGSITQDYSTGVLYPLAPSGFALSEGLVRSFIASVKATPCDRDFSIDVSYELSKLLLKRLNVTITDDPAFCNVVAEGIGSESVAAGVSYPTINTCATGVLAKWSTQYQRHPDPARAVLPSDLIIAVKTTAHFHKSRLPLLKETWAGQAERVQVLYMSNADNGDGDIEVVNLVREFPDILQANQEASTGHCTKCHALLQYLDKHYGTRSSGPRKRFFAVVDDDTMLDVRRLLDLLSWYNFDEGSAAAAAVLKDGGSSFDANKAYMQSVKAKEQAGEDTAAATSAELGDWYIGEHYAQGYTCARGSGADFITMGGGMAMSAPLLERVLQCEECKCYRPNEPDDMRVGVWVSRHMMMPLCHEDAFHQARSDSYHQSLLASQQPVSFHKFTNFMENSETVYDKTKILGRYRTDFYRDEANGSSN